MTPRARKTCRHRQTHHLSWTGSGWGPVLYGVNCYPGWVSSADAAVVCQQCGQWLSLGPSRDDGEFAEFVAVEVRAAELVALGINSENSVRLACAHELCGWLDERRCTGPDVDWHAGYLARAIVEHDPEAT